MFTYPVYHHHLLLLLFFLLPGFRLILPAELTALVGIRIAPTTAVVDSPRASLRPTADLPEPMGPTR